MIEQLDGLGTFHAVIVAQAVSKLGRMADLVRAGQAHLGLRTECLLPRVEFEQCPAQDNRFFPARRIGGRSTPMRR